jgi:SAM-dependent methyltransferase
MSRGVLAAREDSDLREVPDTRFGIWFQGTQIWRRYVVLDTLDVLDGLIAPHGRRFELVLDAGCGHGAALPVLRERHAAARLIGVDSDASAIARAEREQPPGCELRVGDVRRLDLPDACVDLALCHQTLHHVSDQRRALAELWRVIAPGGVLLLGESCVPFIRRWWVRLFFRHVAAAQHTAQEWVELVRRSGFEVDAVATPDPWWSLRDLGLLRRLRTRAPRVSDHTLVCLAAHKPLAGGTA